MGPVIVNTLDIVSIVMVVGIALMLWSGREINKKNRALHERNERERQREKQMESHFADNDHVHG